MKTEYKHHPKHYILTRTLNRKNAKRRICDWFHTKQACYDYILQHYTINCRYDIYSYDWRLIENVDLNKLIKRREDSYIETENN